MILGVVRKIFGSANERALKGYWPVVEAVNALEPQFQGMSDAEFPALTARFKERLAAGETLDAILPEAFAAVREASRRKLGMRHYDVQLVGGMVLHEGKIAEMRTGEGKTLVCTSPAYLNALPGKGVHIVTVNDYLASRDAEWMGPIYEFLGLTVGCIQHGMSSEERQRQYACDITFGTNNEFGFDYLRDNLKTQVERVVQRGHAYAIVDEVDSILIDEARTPLIISGQVEKDVHSYTEFRDPVERLIRMQKKRVEEIFAEALSLPEEGEGSDDRWFKLCQVEAGDPKNKRLFELITTNKETKKRMDRLESELKINKESHRLKEGLLFAYGTEERGVELTDEGQDELAKMVGDVFVIPDMYESEEQIDGNASLSPEEKALARKEVLRQFDEASQKLHNIHQLLRAFTLYEADVDYVVKDGEVVIVDEFTGRLMPGRRWSDGLHQAVEAKERVTIAKATQTVATITLQNYYRMYGKLSGMTGTAETEAAEFKEIYKLDVSSIPTHRPMVRDDMPDIVYLKEDDKMRGIVKEIERVHATGQPVLVGTTSVDKSERLAKLLERTQVRYEVLNAKNHEREAYIIAQAGRKGGVTISTNMAGRGTDILLGGNAEMMVKATATADTSPEEIEALREKLKAQCAREHDEVLALGGLYVLGTERHESRRVDNQLRGRAGRQGDPGKSRFFLSLEDDLMRRFGSDRIGAIMSRMGWDKPEDGEEEVVIESKMVTRSIQNAQRKVEENNFNSRKNLLEYDDVNNKQREIVYKIRNRILRGSPEEIQDYLFETVQRLCGDIAAAHPAPVEGHDDKSRWMAMEKELARYGLFHSLSHDEEAQRAPDLQAHLVGLFKKEFEAKDASVREWSEGKSNFANAVVRRIMLEVIDQHWMDVLYTLDQLRDSVGLRSYGQKDPKLEYKKAAYEAFEDMMSQAGAEWLEKIFGIRLVSPQEMQAQQQAILQAQAARAAHARPQMPGLPASPAQRAASGAPAGPAHASKVDERMMRAIAGGTALAERKLVTNTSENTRQSTVKHKVPKVGRNDPCPCGSGKKYKKCHGADEAGAAADA